MTNPIIILGSSRSFGETRKAVLNVIEDNNTPIVDLNDFDITGYDYEHRNQNDDYIPLMERVAEHDLIVLATPVYWYTMSSTMKVFIDRLSDLLAIKKDLGRKLRGKKLYVISSFNTSLPKGFEHAFEQTCDYMGMHYQGCSFIYSGTDPELLEANDAQISKAKQALYGD